MMRKTIFGVRWLSSDVSWGPIESGNLALQICISTTHSVLIVRKIDCTAFGSRIHSFRFELSFMKCKMSLHSLML